MAVDILVNVCGLTNETTNYLHATHARLKEAASSTFATYLLVEMLFRALSKLKTDVGQNAPSGDRVGDRPMSSGEESPGQTLGNRTELLGNAVLTGRGEGWRRREASCH